MMALPVSLIPDTVMLPPKRSKRSVAPEVNEADNVSEEHGKTSPKPPVVDPKEHGKTSPKPPVVEDHGKTCPKEEEEDAEEVTVEVTGETVEELKRTRTLRQLKDLCASMNLSNVGKKDELAARIVAARSSD